MDPINDPINDLFDFDAFNDNGQDIRIMADQHLFDNGLDLFGVEPSHPAGQTMAVPHSNTRVDPSAHVTPEGYDDPQVLDRNFFNNNLDLFADQNFDAGLTDFAPIDQPISQFMVQQFGENFGLSLEPTPPIMSQMPTLAIEPEMMLNQTQPSPQIVLATFEEQQQWQAFKSQQTQFYQPQPPTPRIQQMEASHERGNVGVLPGLALQSPFESPIDELYQKSPGLGAPPNPQQTADPLQQDFLPDEQIHLLQSAEHGAYVQPSNDYSPTDAALPYNQPNAESSTRSCSTRGRLSLSSRTPTSEQTPQTALADLSFASLEEAKEVMPSRYIENAWEAPSDDSTIPTTQKKRAEYVLDMFEAFQDCSECKDNKNGNSYVKRWLGGPGSYYNLHAMEKVCWHMVDIAERLHNEGPESTNMYCEEALKKLKASRDMTFQQRIYHVCAMLKYSKFLCDQLMKGEGLEALVGAPKLKMSGATTMQVQNQKRQKWIVHGRTEDPHHSNPDRNEADYQDEHGEDQPPPRKTKTKQKTKRSAPAKPRAKPKARPGSTTRDEPDNDEEAAHRRQSDPNISQAEYGSGIEMNVEPQRIIAAVLQIPNLAPPPPSLVAAPTSPVSPSSTTPTPSPTSPKSPKTTPKTKQPKRIASPQVRISRAQVDAGRARFGEASVDKQRTKLMRKKVEAKLAAYRAAAKASALSAEAKATVQGTQLAPSTTTKKAPANKVTATTTTTTKINTKTGTRKRPIDLTETDSEKDELAPKTKRQRTTRELFDEWTIRNNGSNEDDIREAGYAPESGRLSDAEKSDSDKGIDNPVRTDEKEENKNDDEEQGNDAADDEEVDEYQDNVEEDASQRSDDSQSEETPEDKPEHTEEDSSELSEQEYSDSEENRSETSSSSPSPLRKRKIEKVAAKGDKINQVHPLVKTSRWPTKAAREAAKRKQQQTSTPESSKPELKIPSAKRGKRKHHQPEELLISSELETPVPKRTKRNNGSTSKSATPVPAKQTQAPKDKKSGPLRTANSKFVRRKATPEPSPESSSDLNTESELEPESKLEPESEPKKPGPLRDAKGKFVRRKRE
jgi:hypothetical protein